jgi:hypothetical protein
MASKFAPCKRPSAEHFQSSIPPPVPIHPVDRRNPSTNLLDGQTAFSEPTIPCLCEQSSMIMEDCSCQFHNRIDPRRDSRRLRQLLVFSICSLRIQGQLCLTATSVEADQEPTKTSRRDVNSRHQVSGKLYHLFLSPHDRRHPTNPRNSFWLLPSPYTRASPTTCHLLTHLARTSAGVHSPHSTMSLFSRPSSDPAPRPGRFSIVSNENAEGTSPRRAARNGFATVLTATTLV